ncbi:GMC family oxidoreductase [Aureimonas fodinaquatilis]|uniref:GMC family oxidoreductase n=1 Tax=Aureimonas fodinaquatilis TaxID=2565783 RepID=A0A5B0DXH2_9HYPH|nr:GMC oxidoreductase [Aureimonas fodinaquatilis]KAA0970585.1 GMC family oxidoreductase [Aureimonas fodinaquatilis]
MINDDLDGLDDHFSGVCIVGAGPVGISLAVELARLSVPVLLLESGGKKRDPEIQALSQADFSKADSHDDMTIAVARMLGGTSNFWGARCVIYDPVDFMPRPGLVDAKWPIEYQDVYKHYARACELADTGQLVYSAPIAGLETDDKSFSFDSLERWANEQKLQVTHRKILSESPLIDVRLHSAVTDIGLGDDGKVRDVEISRADGSGKRRLGVSTLVLTAGGLESTRLLLATRRKSPDLFGGPDGPLGRYYMGHVIGEIADMTLTSDRLDKAFDFFVHESGSYVRRRFVPSVETQLQEGILNTSLWPVVPPVADPRHQSSILSLVYLVMAYGPVGRLIVAEAIRRRHVSDKPQDVLKHVRNVLSGMPEAARHASNFLIRRYTGKERLPGLFVPNKSRRYGLSYHSEHSPDASSRVWLTDKTDALGLPRLEIDQRFPEADAQSVVKVHDLFEKWLHTTGFGTLEYRMPREDRVAGVMAQARHGTHQIGLIRMADNRREGVVDANLRSFDLDNLYVASAAVLPTSGQANPTLTAIALAVRLANHLAESRFATQAAVAA